MATTSFPAPSGSARMRKLESEVADFGRTIPKMQDEPSRSRRELEEITRRLDIIKGSCVVCVRLH